MSQTELQVNSNAKINNLQALRALAAVVVAFRHLGQQLHFHAIGSFGVDIFFVISGFVMAQICESGRTKWFLWRRIARIVPLYWGATLTLFAISVIAPGLLIETRPVPSDLILSLLFIPFQKATGQVEPFLFLGWTLNYEMYFYVLLALGLLVWSRRAVWFAATAIIAIYLLPLGGSGVLAHFYGNSIVFEFIAGSVIFYLYTALGSKRARRWRVGFIALALLAICAIPWPDFLIDIPQNARAVYLGIPAACLVAGILGLSHAGYDSPWRWIILLGDASYVMYLIHPFVEIGMEKLIVLISPSLAHHLIPMSVLLLAGVALTSVLVYRTIDMPIQRLLRFGSGSRSSKLAGAAQPQ